MTKKFLSILLTLCMLAAFVPCVYAASIVDSGTCGDNLTWTLDVEGILTINGTGDMTLHEDGGGIYPPWGENCENIKIVKINYGVTSIASCAFGNTYEYGCINLKNVTIPNSVTHIGDQAFYDCSNLASINIPASITSIGPAAFYGTQWYNNFSDGVVYLGSILYEYKGDMPANTSITVKNDTTVISQGAFSECENLIGVNLPNTLKRIEDGAFYKCSKLDNITLPNNIEYIGKLAFYGTCWYSNYPGDVLYLNNWLIDCKTNDCWDSTSKDAAKNITSLDVQSGTVGLAAYALAPSDYYEANSVLSTASLPNSLKYICDGAFSGCNSLEKVTLPNSVVQIGNYAFSSSGLTEISIPNSVTEMCNCVFYFCEDLTSVELPFSLNRIKRGMFYGCKSLTSIIIPSSISEISYDAFYIYDNNYEDIPIPGLTIYGCTNTTAETYAKDNGIHFVALDKNNPKITSANVIKSGGTYTFSVNMSDITAPCTLITATYSGGVQTGVKLTPLSAGNTSKTVSITASANSQKIFIWDMHSFKPLCAGKTFYK